MDSALSTIVVEISPVGAERPGSERGWRTRRPDARTVSTAPAIVSAQLRDDSGREAASDRGCPDPDALNALGRKRNGRQWILDFVGDAAGYFAPGGLFLRFEQVGQIFEHHHVAEALFAMLQSGRGGCDVHGHAVERGFHLAGGETHAIGAAQQDFNVRPQFDREHLVKPPADERGVSGGVVMIREEHAQQGGVHVRDVESASSDSTPVGMLSRMVSM